MLYFPENCSLLIFKNQYNSAAFLVNDNEIYMLFSVIVSLDKIIIVRIQYIPSKKVRQYDFRTENRDLLAFIPDLYSRAALHLGCQVEAINQLINKSANYEEHYLGTMGRISFFMLQILMHQSDVI